MCRHLCLKTASVKCSTCSVNPLDVHRVKKSREISCEICRALTWHYFPFFFSANFGSIPNCFREKTDFLSCSNQCPFVAVGRIWNWTFFFSSDFKFLAIVKIHFIGLTYFHCRKKIDLVTPLMEPVLIFSKRHVVGTGVEQHFKMEANILSCSFAITQPTEDQKKRF